MKLSLAANISKLRKECSMTQEQLAEALGVTFAAVSKWERGVATPELNLIAEMADLFEVSMDALIGYEFQNHEQENVIARLKRYAVERNDDDIYADMEKSLKRYPNCFDIVYYSAKTYSRRGFVLNKPEYVRRALPLYQQASMLIKQNNDPDISKTSISNEMAEVYLNLGEEEKALELLKKHNPCCLNHSLIGFILASSCDEPKNALPYLSRALLELTQTHMELVMGYLNVYFKTGDYQEALVMADWALGFYQGLRNPGKQSYIEKSEATLWAIRAEILLTLHKKEEAADSLRKAKNIALRFDKAPDYNALNLRFVASSKPATAFDDMGDTAMKGIDGVIAQFGELELSTLWEQIKTEPA